MTKFSKEVLLTATEDNQYRTTRFSVSECESTKEADDKLLAWIKESPELLKVTGNQKIVDNAVVK